MHAGTMKYLSGILFRQPLRFHTSVLWSVPRRGLRGYLWLQAITSRSACRRWDNKGDRTQPQGGEDCAGVYRDLPIYSPPLGATLIFRLGVLGDLSVLPHSSLLVCHGLKQNLIIVMRYALIE